MSTDVTPIETVDKSAALMEYAQFKQANAEAFDRVDAARAELAEAEAAVAPLMDRARELVAIVGADMLGLLPASETKTPGKRGPRDPNKRYSVLKFMSETGGTIKEIAAGSGQDRAYVQGIVNSLQTADKDKKKADKLIEKSGETGSFSYRYLGEVKAPESTPES